ncbi:MAG TPA: latent transforming growth factor beta-binding protein [Polyangium sp.]|nr:latent transforming growth factor beta-binding protein [Polyangium sp.]
MTHERMAKGLTLLFFAAATLFAACSGEAEPETPEQKYCNQLCDCNKCTEVELGSCLDDKINQKDEAGDADCKDEYSTYLTCLTGDAACSDGDYDESVCFAEESDLDSCLRPAPPACNLANNGICNEPPPKGDGLCAAGSDVNDCKVPVCPTAGDGICDEPDPKGNGTCAAGSDPIDCGISCLTENNGVCDEPGGTGSCAAGTDPTDCYCAYAGDGECDEPEGTNSCPEGSDPLDCGGECLRCSEYSKDSSGTLCSESQQLWFALDACACGTCFNSCETSYCNALEPSATCSDCIFSTCYNQLDACSQDI